MKIAQDYIVPVIRYSRTAHGIEFSQLLGTAFFINEGGIFLSASHVFSDGLKLCEREGGEIGLIMRDPERPQQRFLGKIAGWSCADEPSDVVVGITPHRAMSCFMVNSARIWLWQDVFSLGYAESAVARGENFITPDVRGLKGHIVRKLPSGHLLTKPHPEAYELSFSIPSCMSGSPLVLRWDDEAPEGAPFPLLGVCVGTNTISIGGEAVENYGLAHSISPLLEWKPECLDGLPLGQFIQPGH